MAKGKISITSDETLSLKSQSLEEIAEGAKQEIRDYGEALIKRLNTNTCANPIKKKNKLVPREVHLPHPIAELACRGLLEKIDVSYIDNWEKGEVLIVYADDQTEESYNNLKENMYLYGTFCNALFMGNLSDNTIVEAYIGLIKLGNKVTNENKIQYINITRAELFDEPFDERPINAMKEKTHVFQFRNIKLENGVIKIPVSDTAWNDFIVSDNFFFLYYDNKYSGFIYSPENYDYVFYTDNNRKYFTPKKDSEDEYENFVFVGKNGNGDRVLYFDLSKCREVPIKNSSFNILVKGEWVLDWDCVTFKNGYIEIVPPADGSVMFRSKVEHVAGSLEAYNYIKKYISERLAPVHCSVERMELKIIDNIRLNDAIMRFASTAKQKGVQIDNSHKEHKPVVQQKSSFDTALSKAQQMSPEEFRKYKSKYIDYLVSVQSKNYKIIPCIEHLAYFNNDMFETAFLFSISCKSNNILVVFENVSPSRSTIIFKVKEQDFMDSIREIYDFLQGSDINKRSSLRGGNVIIDNANILSYHSINHDNFLSWKRVIISNLFQ